MKSCTLVISLLCWLSACAARQPDHFYVLTMRPQSTHEPMATPVLPVSLRVTLPSVVDRSEIVLNTGAEAVIMLEHERWAAPLNDLVTQTLAEDMEQRRRDVLIAGPSAGSSVPAALKVTVDIVHMSARKGGRVTVGTHWRIFNARGGQEAAGGEEFSAPVAQDGYAAIAQALSECLALLADRLVAQMPHPN